MTSRPSRTQAIALWVAHGQNCPYCCLPIKYELLEIDHIVPQTMKGQPDELHALVERLGMPTLDLNSYANWLPVHGRPCNREKSDEILPDSALHNYLSIARRHEESARQEENRIRLRSLKIDVMAPLFSLIEDGVLSKEEVISNLESVIAIRKTENFDSAAAFREVAGRYMREGQYEESYTASMRATELFCLGRFYSDAVECLVNAVTALRPIRNGRRLRTTVLKVERLCARFPITEMARWHFLDRLALILFDYGRWKKAAEVQSASELLRKGIYKDPQGSQTLDFDSANSRRRAAVIKGCAYALAPGQDIRKVLAELLDEAHDFRNAGQFNAYITNLDVASKLASEILGDRDLAHGYSEEAINWGQFSDNWWVRQEHHWREYEFFSSKHDKQAMSRHASEALKLHQQHPVVLTPILINGRPVAHDPFVSFKIAVIREPLSAIPFDLTDERLDEIVRTVHRS